MAGLSPNRSTSETSLEKAKRERTIGRDLLQGRKPGIISRLRQVSLEEVLALIDKYPPPKKGRVS